MDEVKGLADDKGRIVIVIRGRVYDATQWAPCHPGGSHLLLHAAGKDMTDQFDQFHLASTHAHARLRHLYIADLPEPERCTTGLRRDWANFVQQITKEGVYESNHRFFVCEFLRALAFLVGAVALLLYLRSCVASGVLFGLYLQQMAFLGHDAGHTAITHNYVVDTTIGLIVGNMLTGIGIGWWKSSHNNHHMVCNSIEGDADIQHLPLLCCNPKILEKPFYSLWHKTWYDASGIATRSLLRVQHILFYPVILLFGRYNLYAQSWGHVLRGRSRTPLRESGGLLLFAVGVACLLSLLPSWQGRCLFVLVSHGVAGILNIQITLSHFCMQVYHGLPYDHTKGIQDQWVGTQLRTTLALTCPPWMDWFHGGLQFQDVHHLLPRVPRHNLRALRPRIQALAKKHECGHLSPEMGFLAANAAIMRLVYASALVAWGSPPSRLEDSPLYETLFAIG